MEQYQTLRAAAQAEFVEKRSRFIGYAMPVKTSEEALAFIARISKQHWDATHNVYAYIIRNEGVKRYSDDGEPQGTAGIPTLDVLEKQGLTDCCVVVTRYFGGVLLGAGGLFRAYSKAAKDALDNAGVSVVRRWVEAEFSCSYGAAERLKNELGAFDALVTDTRYAADVTLRLLVPEEKAEALSARISDASAGTVALRSVGESLRPVRIR